MDYTEEEVIHHIVPNNDLRPHPLTENCWCRPTVWKNDDGYTIITHNSLDRRELYENEVH